MKKVNSNIGKCMALTLALALTAASVNNVDVQAAKKAKAKLAKTKLTVTVGKTAVIKLKKAVKKAKYSYRSDKKKIASVTSKGKVRGKKPGIAKITVTEKTGKKKFKVGTVKVTVKGKTNKQNTTVPTPTNAAPGNQATALPGNTVTTPPGNTATAAPTNAAGTPSPALNPTTSPTVRPTKTPRVTPTPTVKPDPPKDTYAPETGEGAEWNRLSIADYVSVEEDNGYKDKYFYEKGEQIDLQGVELMLFELPFDVESGSIEVLVRGTNNSSDGFRFWLNNASGVSKELHPEGTNWDGTMSKQYKYTSSAVGIAGGSEEEAEFISKGDFQIQTVLDYTGEDYQNGKTPDDPVAKYLMLKAPSAGGRLDGVRISGIWVRIANKGSGGDGD